MLLKQVFTSLGIAALACTLVMLSSCGILDTEDENPTITLTGDNPDTIRVNDPYNEPGWSASDPEDGDLTSAVTVNYGSLDTASAAVGTYTITYSVTDNGGNTATASRIVVVVDSRVTITGTSLASCPVTFADTQVIYAITSNLTITGGCSVTFGAHTKTYVEANIKVEQGGELTILEGASFYFDDGNYIDVGGNGNGTLKIKGTADDSVLLANLTAGTRWGYGSSATYSGGLWFDDGATAQCSLTYCIIDSATSGMYVSEASVTISHCRISNGSYFGCYFDDGGMPKDSSGFFENVITGNAEYGIGIHANYAGALSGTGSVAGNNKGGILIEQDAVEQDAVWKKHDASYVVDGSIKVESASGATLTIRPGARFELKEGAYFDVGESEEGTLIAEGTEIDSIVFTSYSSGTAWGYGSSATYSGGIWIDDFATSNTSLKYCVIDSATTGIYIVDASVAVSNCRIADNTWFGIYFDDGGTPVDSAGFVDNTITGNGEYGVGMHANFVGALSGTGFIAGNTNGGILIEGDAVESDAVWKSHDAAYVVDGAVKVESAGGVTLAIRPGTR
ncbi:MAG: DUF5011 domain-containing protein, partial [Chitinivibrionales bacterium]|nr:DUF5011 domain-containing protein [Chitinivibrionales bacterium]